jgi:hypothetical protein
MMQRIRAILSVLAILREAIESVEALFPEQGAGQWKLGAVLDIVQEAASDFVDDFESIKPTIVRIIDRVVEAKNKLGAWFSKSE